MNKKSKTARTSNNSNNGLTSNFLDERGEAMLNSSTVANTGAECSPIFRHSGSIYQIGNKVIFSLEIVFDDWCVWILVICKR